MLDRGGSLLQWGDFLMARHLRKGREARERRQRRAGLNRLLRAIVYAGLCKHEEGKA